MDFVKGDILNAKHGIICHQMNCSLIFESELSRALASVYPLVKAECKRIMGRGSPADRLGKCQIVEVIKNKLFIASLFGQFNYGIKDALHTDYSALAISIRALKDWHSANCSDKFPIFFPQDLGCGSNGGGDWKVVKGIIMDIVPDAVIVRVR